MDIITMSKLTNFFTDDNPKDLEMVMLQEEINELMNLDIIYVENNNYCLNKRNLYLYAKKARNKGLYDLAIVALEYLVSTIDTKNEKWLDANYYQLFKNYFYKGNYHRAYEYFKLSFNKKSDLYLIILNAFKYLLKQQKRDDNLEEEIVYLYENNKFRELKEIFSNDQDSSHQKIALEIFDKVDEQRDLNVKIVKEAIEKDDLNLLIDSIYKIRRDYQDDATIGFILYLANLFKCLKEDRINEISIRDLAKIIDTYRSNNMSYYLKENNYDEIYLDSINLFLEKISNYLATTKYNYYIKNEASRLLNRVINGDDAVIIDNLACQDNVHFLTIAKKAKKLDYKQIDNSFGKKIIVFNNAINDNANIEEIKNLYEAKDYQKCLKKCLDFIVLDPENNKEGYYYAALCYWNLGDERQSTKYQECYKMLEKNDFGILGVKIDSDFNFYGINDIKRILEFSNTYNKSLDFACISYGLNESQIELVKLLIAKCYFAIGDDEKANFYINSLSSKDLLANTLIEEIKNPDTYKYTDYHEAKEYINILERKK